MTITWRNIDIGGQGSANALLAAGAETVTRGLNTLSNAAETQSKREMSAWNETSQNNTSDLLAKLSTYTDAQKLTEEAQSGEFAIDKLDANFGRQYNKTAVTDAVGSKVKSLQEAALLSKQRDEVEANKKITLEQMNRRKLLDGAAAALAGKYSDPNELQAHILAASRKINPDGLLTGSDVNQVMGAYTDRLKGIGLDSVAQQESTFETAQAGQVIQSLTGAIDSMEKSFMKAGGFDTNLEQELNDNTPVDAVIPELVKALIDKGGVESDISTVALQGKIADVNNQFADAGLPPPNGRVLKSILVTGGHDENFVFDAEYEIDRDVVASKIAAIQKNQIFKESNVAKLMEFAMRKNEITESLSKAAQHNQSERLLQARSKAVLTESYTPQFVNVNQLSRDLYQSLGAISDMKPTGFSTPAKEDPKVPDKVEKVKSMNLMKTGLGNFPVSN